MAFRLHSGKQTLKASAAELGLLWLRAEYAWRAEVRMHRCYLFGRVLNRQGIHFMHVEDIEHYLPWHIKKARIIGAEVSSLGSERPFELSWGSRGYGITRRSALDRKARITIRRPEAKRIFAAMVDRDQVGIRLLMELHGNALLSTVSLARAIDADVDVVAPALTRLREVGLVRLHGDFYHCTHKANEFLHKMENLSDVSISSPSEYPHGTNLREAVHDTLLIKGEASMKGGAAFLPIVGTTEGADVDEDETEITHDANYRAYLAEIDDLEKEGKYSFVAYANGTQIAKASTFDDLISQIGDREEEVLIQEIPARVVQFRERFRVEA